MLIHQRAHDFLRRRRRRMNDRYGDLNSFRGRNRGLSRGRNQAEFNLRKPIRFVYQELRILKRNHTNRGQAASHMHQRRFSASSFPTLTAMKCRMPDSSNSFGTLSWLPLNKFRRSTIVSSAVPRMASVLTKIVEYVSI
jgi:hypothetical protein